METLWQDVRYAVRMLRKNPGFTAVAVLTLALGIGANTTIFSVVNAVLLKPLPYPEPGQLVQLRADWSGSPSTVIGSSTFVEVKAQSQSLARIAAYSGGDMTLTGAGSAEQVVAGAVTADFFPLLGIQPAWGRNFTREEDTPNGPKAAILGHGLWQSRFGGDADVLGRTITLNEQSYTVVGVLPARFQYPEQFQLWIPLALGETGAALAKYGEGMILLKAIARLKPGVTLEQAQAELRTIAQREQSPRPDEAPVVSLVTLHEQVVGDVRGALLVLLGAVALVLLIACANVADLQLARAAARQREMAVRAALGAARWRIVRGLVTESVLLSLAGGGLGLLLAFWGIRALGQWSGASLPSMHGIGIDAWVLAFTLGVSVITGLAFGLAPAEVEPNQALHNVMTMEQRLANTTTSRRLNTALLGSFAAVALLLAVVGIYGVMSYAVTQRTREIGMRMALGAQRSDVRTIVVRRGMTLTFLGVVIGLTGSFALTRVLSSLLYEVKPTDPMTFLSVTLLLIVVAMLACYLPARRAARIDPMVALRCE